MLILGRLVTGLVGGSMSMIVPTYIGEFSSPHIRGTLGKFSLLSRDRTDKTVAIYISSPKFEKPDL